MLVGTWRAAAQFRVRSNDAKEGASHSSAAIQSRLALMLCLPACRWGTWKSEGCLSYEKRSSVALQLLQPLKLAPKKTRGHGGKVDVGVPAINK